MTLSETLEELKLGGKVYRAGWNGKGMHLYLHNPLVAKTHEPNTLPYLVMYTGPSTGNHVPWLASQTDILAEDWSIR